jgi:hypothetical protein
MPSEWKKAVVNPLYKGKGPLDSVDSNRGIAILTPINKAFERILSKQIVNYLNRILFLSNHSNSDRPEVLNRLERIQFAHYA